MIHSLRGSTASQRHDSIILCITAEDDLLQPPIDTVMTMQDLPVELLEKIFKGLDLETLSTIEDVCKRWRQVVNGNYIQRTIYETRLREAHTSIRKRDWIAQLFSQEEKWLLEHHQELQSRPHVPLAIGKSDMWLVQLDDLVNNEIQPRPGTNYE